MYTTHRFFQPANLLLQGITPRITTRDGILQPCNLLFNLVIPRYRRRGDVVRSLPFRLDNFLHVRKSFDEALNLVLKISKAAF